MRRNVFVIGSFMLIVLSLYTIGLIPGYTERVATDESAVLLSAENITKPDTMHADMASNISQSSRYIREIVAHVNAMFDNRFQNQSTCVVPLKEDPMWQGMRKDFATIAHAMKQQSDAGSHEAQAVLELIAGYEIDYEALKISYEFFCSEDLGGGEMFR